MGNRQENLSHVEFCKLGSRWTKTGPNAPGSDSRFF